MSVPKFAATPPARDVDSFRLYPDPQHPRPVEDRSTVSSVGVPRFGRVLSTALAMKGGVSLAVWIGGAVCEIDVVRRIRIESVGGELLARFVPDPDLPPEELSFVLRRADLYAQLLVSRRFDRVEFDVLAGASAGGLNSVLYGVAQRAGVAVDGLMDVWIDSGSVWNLLQRRNSWSLPSVLSADYFWDQVTHAIHSFYRGTGVVEHVTPELTVDLSATITDIEYASMPGSDPHGHFHFLGIDERAATANPEVTGEGNPFHRDIPSFSQLSAGAASGEISDAGEQSIRRLAYAARTTSSFPGAFEQARVWSSSTESPAPLAPRRTIAARLLRNIRSLVPQDLLPALPPDTTVPLPPPVDMTYAFSAHRTQVGTEAKPIRVMDGGVLDNIPIDRLFRAIRDRTPEHHAVRIAVYLDPSPDEAPLAQLRPEASDPPRPGDHGGNRGRQSFLATVSSGLSLRGIQESEAAETEALEDALDDALVARNRSVSYSSVLRHHPLTERDRGPLRAGYLGYRAETDAILLRNVLGNPDLWQLTTDLTTRSRWTTTDPGWLRGLDRAFLDAYAQGTSELAAVATGSQALRDASLCALDWMRAIEERAFLDGRHDVTGHSDLRTSLHRVAVQARQLRDQHIRTLMDRRATMIDAGSSTATAEYRAEDAVTEWLAVEGTVEPERDVLWTELTGLRRRLAAEWERLAASEVASPTIWASFPTAWAVEDLAPFAAPAGIPDPFSLQRYSKITASDPGLLDEIFGPLLVAKRASVVGTWLRLPSSRFRDEAVSAHLPTHLDAGAKLAGSALGNFGAFFSRAWRKNDWWWGRMDAAAGVIGTLELLPSVEPLDVVPLMRAAQRLTLLQLNARDVKRPYPREVEAPDRAAEAEATREIAADPSTTAYLTPDEIALANTIATRDSAGAHSLAQLRPGYLVSVASRASRLVVRALRSGQSVGLQLVVTLLLPPLLILAPLAFATLRIAFIVTALFAFLRFVGDPTAAPTLTMGWGEWALWVIALVGFVLGALGTGRVWARVRFLRRRGSAMAEVLGVRAGRAFWRSLALLVIGAASLVIALARDLERLPVDAALVYLCLTAVVTGMAAARTASTLEAASYLASTVTWATATAVAASVLLLPQDWVLLAHSSGTVIREAAGWWHVPTHAAGLAAALVFAAATWGWIGDVTFVSDRRRVLGLIPWALLTAVVGLAASGTAWVVLSLIASGHNTLLTNAEPTFGSGLVAGLAVWFVASHVGWWLSDLLPTWWLGDIDEPKFAKPDAP